MGCLVLGFGAVITVVLNVLLIPFFGYLGAAWATLVCYASMMAVSYYYGQRYYPVPYDLAAFAYLIGSALLIFSSANGFAVSAVLPGKLR